MKPVYSGGGVRAGGVCALFTTHVQTEVETGATVQLLHPADVKETEPEAPLCRVVYESATTVWC